MKKGTINFAIAIKIFLFMIAVICMLTFRVYAQDVEYARGGVVPVVFAVKDARIMVYDSVLNKYVEDLGPYDGEILSRGSGFFVGNPNENPKYIVTNHHVVEDYYKANEGEGYFFPFDYYMPEEYGDRYTTDIVAPSCEMRVYFSENEYQVAYLEVPGDVNKVDLAVLKLLEPTDKRHALTLALPNEEMVGTTKVSTIGYPGNADNEFTSASKFGINDSTIHNGTINRIVADDKGVERIATDATIQHGNSGGPLVNEDGYVIGVNTNVESNKPYDDQIEADYYAINSSELIRVLDKNSIPYQMASEEGAITATDSSEYSSASPVASEPEKESEEKTGIGVMPIIAGVVVLVVIIGIIVALSKKKKNTSSINSTVAAPQTPSPAPVANKKAMLRSLSVQHNGMTVAVHSNSQILIGRDPANCKVVFREGTEGISGRHCSVTFDESSQDFIITDLRSTYGTFLLNGQKLNPNVPYHIKAGDGFYLGTQENSFRVEVG